MLAVKKYKLQLPRLVKNNMHKTNIFLWWIPVGRLFLNQKGGQIFEKEIWNSEYKRVSLCVFLRDIAIL